MKLRRKKERPTARNIDDQMTLFEHLAELRTRIIRAVLAVVIGIIVIMVFYDQVLEVLLKPYQNLCEDAPKNGTTCEVFATSPLEGFSTRLSVATYGGIILALPVILWQVWRFIVPAMHAKEKRYAIPFVLSSVILFIMGGALAYVTLGQALEFLIAWSGEDVNALYRVGEYIKLVGLMIAAFGISFEFPVLLVFLQLVGVLTPQTLLRGWRYAIMIIFVIAAVITPSGDPYSMMAMAIPMSLFYLVSIGIGRVHQKRKLAREAAEA